MSHIQLCVLAATACLCTVSAADVGPTGRVIPATTVCLISSLPIQFSIAYENRRKKQRSTNRQESASARCASTSASYFCAP
eukprot:6209931-Pleurochrysis_carterae.AAC.1